MSGRLAAFLLAAVTLLVVALSTGGAIYYLILGMMFFMFLFALLSSLAALLFGSLSSLLYAFAGALLAVPCMALLRRCGGFSCVGASVAGGAAHNLGQLAAAVLAAETPGLAAYLPVLLVAGAITGFVNGALALAVRKRFP